MDLPLDSIKLPPWEPAMADEWDEAFEKVENCLRAHRVASRLHRARLTALIVQRAMERRAAGGPDAEQSLATVAVDETRERINEWLQALLPGRTDRPPAPAEGLVALYLCDGPMRWPNAFLNSTQTPPAFSDSLKSRVIRAGPELEVSSMVPRTIDLGLLPEVAGSAMASFERLPRRSVLLWVLFIVSLVALFWYTRGL